MNFPTKVIEAFLLDHADRQGYPTGWDFWSSERGTETQLVEHLGSVAAVEQSEAARDSYGDTCGPVSVVVRVRDEKGKERFFKKSGYADSYDGSKWDGELTEVKPTTKTVTAYE